MGDKLANDIVTATDDKAAAEVFYWGLIGGEQGVANGSMPTGGRHGLLRSCHFGSGFSRIPCPGLRECPVRAIFPLFMVLQQFS